MEQRREKAPTTQRTRTVRSVLVVVATVAASVLVTVLTKGKVRPRF